jgi:uncharacterized protein YkwD
VTAPSPYEQETLELINRARANPSGEFGQLITNAATGQGVEPGITSAIRAFNVDLALFASQLQAYPAVAPVAWSNQLSVSATRHSELMLQFDTQSHNLPGESSLGDRFREAGYDFRSAGENIFAFGESAVFSHAGFYIDWGFGPGGIQNPAGHRDAILSSRYTEVGVGVVVDTNTTNKTGPNLVTHHFGLSGNYSPQLVGVAFADADGDNFYDAGEGLGGVTVTATGTGGSFTTQSWDAGGYQMVLPAGTYTVSFSGSGLSLPAPKTVSISTQNVKVDAMGQKSTEGVASQGSDRFIAKAENETLNGQGGLDTVVFTQARAVAVVNLTNDGQQATVTVPGAGVNTYQSIERLQFSDGVIALDLNGNAGQVYRLYRTAFDRTPDDKGLSDNVAHMDRGMTIQEMSSAFINSAEFIQTYGSNTDDATFLNLLYQNVFDRAPDPGGFAHWSGKLAAGDSRASIIPGFAESAENKAAVLPFIDDGIFLI